MPFNFTTIYCAFQVIFIQYFVFGYIYKKTLQKIIKIIYGHILTVSDQNTAYSLKVQNKTVYPNFTFKIVINIKKDTKHYKYVL